MKSSTQLVQAVELAANLVAAGIGCKVSSVYLCIDQDAIQVIFKDPYADYYISRLVDVSALKRARRPGLFLGRELTEAARELMDYYEPD